MSAIEDFINGYMVAMLWAESDLNRDDDDDMDTTFSDDGYTPDDFTDDVKADLRADALAFYWANRRMLRAAYAIREDYTPEHAGHDYYFTQAGHGVGYWDRGLGEVGTALSKACNRREFNLYTTENATRVGMD